MSLQRKLYIDVQWRSKGGGGGKIEVILKNKNREDVEKLRWGDKNNLGGGGAKKCLGSKKF